MDEETEMKMYLSQQLDALFEHSEIILNDAASDDDWWLMFDELNTLRAVLNRWIKFNRKWSDFVKDIFSRWERPSREYYPRTGQHGYVDHLVEYLEQVMNFKADDNNSLLPMIILQLQPMLQLLSQLLVEIPELHKQDIHLKILINQSVHLAYETEYAIDLFLVKHIPLWYCVIWLQHIKQEVKDQILQLNAQSGDVESIIKEINEWDSDKFKIIPMMIDIDETNEKLDEIFKAVAGHFDICSWSSVSSYKEREKEVFLQLVHNAISENDYLTEEIDKIRISASGMTKDELKESVHDILEGTYYVIILKDMYDIEDLDDIIKVLPDKLGSRILVTTYSPELFAYCRSGCQKDLFITKISEDHSSTSQTRKPTTEGDLVGFKVEKEMMLERLTGGPRQLHIISIAGMAGQGKTTFAKKLYNDLSIVSHFHKRAWSCVSQVYEKEELLLELLGQVVQLSDAIRQANDHELAAMLWRSLKGRRFLVVLDDIWSTKAWNDLRQCFPDDKSGSRIVFTTRLQELASQAQPRSVLQPLARLSDDESWTLLHNRLFLEENESCPPELFGIGMEIAKSCKGLPLSVVLTAGLLKKKEKRKDVWKGIAESLSSSILGEADEEDRGVINLSYKHLPYFLKPCFLYFGAFLEDREVPVQKLIRLWIAEGFIKSSDSKTLEEVAEDYLKDLIGRSLVTVSQEKSRGGAKSCRVHDLLHEFALMKATEENFLQPIQGYDEHFPSCNDNLDYGLDEKFSNSLEPITYYHRRVSIYSKRNHFLMLKPSSPVSRSLLFFAASDMCPTHSYDISFMFDNFKLLKILKCEDINIGNSFDAIGDLLHLRYLEVQGSMASIPSSIANLWNLETICVKSLENEALNVPNCIWNMEKLRHVHIKDRAFIDIDPDILEDSIGLDNLQTLSTISLVYGNDMEKLLRKLRGLRKLKCIFLDSWDDARKCNRFPVLEFLTKLESLKVFYNGERRYPCLFNFPSNLKKLTLTDFRMPWNEISQIATVENLEVLKLLGNVFEGERWEMEDEVFPKLKLLKLDNLNFREWIAPGDNFPSLQRLIMHNCAQLNEIPTSIGDITTLLMVEVKWCSRSATISTREIQEMQSDVGNEEFKIIVHPKIWDSESSS